MPGGALAIPMTSMPQLPGRRGEAVEASKPLRLSAEAEEGARQAADDLRLQLVSHQRIGHQLQLKLDHQAEHVKELEQALLGLGEDGKLSGWNRFCRQRSLPRIHPESDEFRSFDGFVLSTLERGQTKKTPGPGGRC